MQANPSEGRGDFTAGTSGYEYNTLMSALQVSVSKHLLDECFTMVWGNDFYYKIIGYPKDEYEAMFQNNPVAFYTHHGYLEELEAIRRVTVQALTNGEPGYSILTRMPVKGGGAAWVRMTGTFTQEMIDGKQVSYTVITDVTEAVEQKQLQKQLEDQAEQLKRALEAAESASRAKSDFLSRMSHDIRTPMNAIVGMTEIAAAHLDNPDKVHSCLKKIALSSQHLLGLINDVLDMSKIESGKMALRCESMLLPEVLENVIAIIQPMIKSRGQQFSIRLHNVVHERFTCDSLRLRQVFINILSNASKFTPEGGRITVDVEEAPQDRPGEARFRFTFSDTGMGIRPEFLAHIFDAFTRERDNRVDKTEGSGLGMAITQKIVEMMGGAVTVESEWGKGSTFTVMLPLRIEAQEPGEWRFPGIRVLVADDDDVMCEYTVEMLRACGVEARWVNSGRAAVEQVSLAHERGEALDAVIVDWKMPGQDGVETVRQIRGRVGAGVPILIASAYDWTEIEAEALAAGANGFLPKPLFRSTLLQGLNRYVLGREEEQYLRSGERRYDFSGKTFLLAEDNLLNQEIAMELIGAAGAVLEPAADGVEAVERFAASPVGYYDLILMDIQMPRMDGYQATRIIRAMDRPDAARVPIFAMTADAFAEDEERCLAVGMNAHISKPIEINSIYAKLSGSLRGD